jgi:hypothetical protein
MPLQLFSGLLFLQLLEQEFVDLQLLVGEPQAQLLQQAVGALYLVEAGELWPYGSNTIRSLVVHQLHRHRKMKGLKLGMRIEC